MPTVTIVMTLFHGLDILGHTKLIAYEVGKQNEGKI